jgi:hypothetical protein
VTLANNIDLITMIDTRINEWSKLKFVDPGILLPRLRQIQQKFATSNLNENIKNLRTNKLKTYREGWEAALFCCGMKKVMGITVYVSSYEASDYDAIAMWVKDETQHFAPLQIKEIVPHKLNPETDINKEIAKLTRYSVSNDTTVVIHVNRIGRLELRSIKVPKLNIASLWLIGTTKPEKDRWAIVGDMLSKPEITEFDYPGV